MEDKSIVRIKTRRRILKYKEGQNPEVDEPYEVDVKEEILTGEEAERFIKELGGAK
jgi:hypothetical protein